MVAKITTMSLTFYLGSNLNKESQPKKKTKKTKKQKKNLNLNLQLRNCLNQNWRQTSSRCYMEAALVCILSAVHILFSGVDTGEGYGPKDNSYQETPRLPGRWGGRGTLFQALSPWHWEGQGPHSTAKETEAQKNKMCLSSSWQSQMPDLSDAEVCARVSTCLSPSQRKGSRSWTGVWNLYQGHHPGSMRGSQTQNRQRQWGGGQGSLGLWLLSR